MLSAVIKKRAASVDFVNSNVKEYLYKVNTPRERRLLC